MATTKKTSNKSLWPAQNRKLCVRWAACTRSHICLHTQPNHKGSVQWNEGFNQLDGVALLLVDHEPKGVLWGTYAKPCSLKRASGVHARPCQPARAHVCMPSPAHSNKLPVCIRSHAHLRKLTYACRAMLTRTSFTYTCQAMLTCAFC
eukprot:scaffold183387_cov17-Tisochrysis_lutea.AAC.1